MGRDTVPPRNHPVKGGFAIALAAAAVLSTTAIFIRYLSVNYAVPALVTAFWRDVFVVATLVPALAIIKPGLLPTKSANLPWLALYGFVLALFNALWTLSVSLNGAAVATVLVYSSGAFTVVLGRIFLGEPLGLGKVGALCLSLAGCVLVSGAWEAAAWRLNVLGMLCGVLSGLAYAVYSLFGRSASKRGIDPWTTLLYIFAFAAVFLLGMNLLPGSPLPGSARSPADLLWLGNAWFGWLLLFLLAAGPTVVGFGLYLVSLVRLPSSVANLLVSTEPFFTAVVAFLLLGERLGPAQLVGGFLILGGVAVLRLAPGTEGGGS